MWGSPALTMAELDQPMRTSVIQKDSIIFNALIGEGGFGRVLSGMVIKNRTWYAVKEINKYSVTQHQTGLSMLFSELRALQIVNVEPQNNFIVGLQAAFHDTTSCYLVLDLKTGGDLRYYLRKRLIFEESDVAFYVACISSALEFIHSRNILHRDVKPENIILDSRGYPHLTDFGVAYVQPAGTEGVLTCRLASGTKQYLAPEVYCKRNLHGIASDYWSLGVLTFELLYGQRPFEKHCPTLHINYLEECLKRTAIVRLSRNCSMKINRHGSFEGSPRSSRDYTSEINSPTRSQVNSSHTNMTSASTQKTAAMPTVDALFSRKKRNPRMFPEIQGPGPLGGPGGLGEGESVLRGSREGLSGSVLNMDPPTSRPHYADKPDKIEKEKTEEVKTIYETCSSNSPPAKPINRNADNKNNDESERADRQDKPDKADRPVLSLLHCPLPPSLEEEDEYYTNEAAKTFRSGCYSPPRRGTFDKAVNLSPHRKVSSFVDFEEEEEGGFITVDHWTVHANVLPIQLQVLIPKESDWLGEISESCIEVLKGFFDVRPSHRIGGRNITALREHSWFLEKNIPGWEDLARREYTPNFIPDKIFMQKTFWRPEALESYMEENNAPKPELNIERVHLFDNFVHTSELFLKLFDDKNVESSDEKKMEEKLENQKNIEIQKMDYNGKNVVTSPSNLQVKTGLQRVIKKKLAQPNSSSVLSSLSSNKSSLGSMSGKYSSPPKGDQMRVSVSEKLSPESRRVLPELKTIKL